MIRLEREGQVGMVVLDRPDRRNALTPEMLADLGAGAARLAAESRALVLCGEGRVFCSGFDLALCERSPDGSAMRALLAGLSRAIVVLRGLPAPVVIAAHGAAIAGGCALLGGADVVVADRGARLGYPVVRLGVSPAVSAPFLAAGVGWGRARERMLDPALIDGARAQEIGLVHELVEAPGEVRARAMEVAQALAAKPPGALAATRSWLAELDGSSEAGAVERALDASLALAGGEEERTLLAAALRRS